MKFEKEDNWYECREFKSPGLSWSMSEPGIYSARVTNQNWKIRMNNFPDDPAYTLIVDGVEIIHFNDWPEEWKK